MQVAKTVDICTKNGDVMTIDMSDVLLQKIQEAFGLAHANDVSPRHVEAFLISSMKNALKEHGEKQ